MKNLESSHPFPVGFPASVVARIGRERRYIVAWLNEIQDELGYLPQEALEALAECSEASLAELTDVVTFHSHFRLAPCGTYRIRVCVGTACHVKGAEALFEAFRRHLGMGEGQDTDPQGVFTVEKVACLGCCALAPAVQIGDILYGPVATVGVADVLRDFLEAESGGAAASARKGGAHDRVKISVRLCTCTSCAAAGAAKVAEAFRDEARRTGLRMGVEETACLGASFDAPLVTMVVGKRVFHYARVKPHHVEGILARHTRSLRQTVFAPIRNLLERLPPHGNAEGPRRYLLNEEFGMKNEEWGTPPPSGLRPFGHPSAGGECNERGGEAFLAAQVRLATERAGEMGPLDLEGYLRHGGFQNFGERTGEKVIETLQASGLRGRGGAGFPTWRKWAGVLESSRAQSSAVDGRRATYVVCNGDEGDPGAFMDRMALESFPFRVVEGMLIAMRTVGARHGILYIREEYPLAVRRVRDAIRRLREHSDVAPRIAEYALEVVVGAGAFVCGEETALLQSIQGLRPMPQPRPPYPSERGLWGCPTLVNNVETFALVPWILRHGAEAFAAYGTARSAGTKLFALAGNVKHGGLVEVPMGMSLKRIVEDIGGGTHDGAPFKAVLVGGPSGGCVPYRESDVKVDYEQLVASGAMMGSGGFVVLGERDCMVDVVRYFMRFTQNESCGRCVPCRLGTKRMLEMLDDVAEGRGSVESLRELEKLAMYVKACSLCGLGKSAPNPVLSALRHFWDEFEAHTVGQCPAGRCKALSTRAVGERCVGCTKCAQACPSDAIRSEAYRRHEIDSAKCTLCDACLGVCPVDAILRINRETRETREKI